jgi:hypothetical protein
MLTKRQYSICAIQDEVRALISRGSVNKQQQIYSLARYFSDSEWQNVEQILETHDYRLRDSICDLVGKESWFND